MTMKRAIYGLGIAVILVTALYVRSAGLMRGLNDGFIFHPDVPKQVHALSNYLHDNYLWYIGSRFYDGYPYGLNHLDEWIIRAAYLVIRPVHDHLNTESVRLNYPDGVPLYYWVLCLRLIYGMIVVMLGLFVARRLLQSRPAAYATAFLLALAPLSFTVTHFATGDIGVDLFVAATLAALCAYARSRLGRWILLAGFFCGCAFACKYQGALAFFAVGTLLLLEVVSAAGGIRAFLGKLGLGFAGMIAGAFIGTPALFINPHRTWHDMRVNFQFIQNYGVDSAFLAKPLHERAWYGLTHTPPYVFAGLGWIVSALALAGLVWATVSLWKNRRELRHSATASFDLLAWTLLAFPFFVLLVSTTLKPAVQRFHFSYLELPVCVGAVWTLLKLAGNGRPAGRWAAALLFAAAATEFEAGASRELFFWHRDGAQQAANGFAFGAFQQPLRDTDRGSDRQVLKYFYLQNDSLAVFRNRPIKVLHGDPQFWKDLGVVPVPTIPFPGHCDWIFLNGPVLPRNDRMFAAEAGRTSLRDIVAYGEPPRTISVGLRSGPRPVEASLRLGGATADVRLGRNEQKIVELSPSAWRTMKGAAPGGKDVLIASLSIRPRLGKAWVAVMTDPREVENFRRYGGEAVAPVEHNELPPKQELVKRLSETAFLQDAGAAPVSLSTNPVPLIPGHAALPAGAYILECALENPSNDVDVVFEAVDPSRVRDHTYSIDGEWDTRKQFTLTPGAHVIRYEFTKPFAPYEMNIAVAASREGAPCKIVGWKLYPDTEKILGALDEESSPAWLARFPRHGSCEETQIDGLPFGDAIVLKSYSFPAAFSVGQAFSYGFRFDIQNYRLRNFDELVLYVHVDNADLKTLATFDVPLRLVCFGQDPMIAFRDRMPPDLPPGEYSLAVGIYNVRTQIKLKPAPSEKQERWKGGVKLGTIVIR
jgi:hypothetical protein